MTVLVACFASGDGTNFENLARSDFGGCIAFLHTDRPDCGAVARAASLGIPVRLGTPEELMLDGVAAVVLAGYDGVAAVVLAGYMRILSPAFIARFRGRIINIHPSLLPSLPGRYAVRRALEAGLPETGVTVHEVIEEVDAGPIVAQERIAILPGESLESLSRRIHELEYRLYPATLREWLPVAAERAWASRS